MAELCGVLPVQMNPVPFPVAEMWESGWESTLWHQGRILGLAGQQEAGAAPASRDTTRVKSVQSIKKS